ncbi:MAG TPA: FHA domain-containing protein, partial [Phycisphaerales bacterium]|nr:FHA domain-containing protein [Phycisphaerales bacterium]
MLILSVIAGPDKGRRFELPSNEPQLIGRSSEALQLGDNTISRRHAELTPDDGAWYIRDLSSQNGTYVNGVRIAERTKLRLGDQIRCGSTLFSYGHSGADEDELDLVRVLRPDQIDASIERALASNDDSVILAEPEPRAAALHHLQVIYQLTALTAHAATRDELLAGVMELVFNEFRPERGFIILCEAETSDAPSAGAATGANAAASGAAGGGG